MALVKVPTSFNIDVEFEIPEFYRRLIALLIDVLIQYLYIRLAVKLYESIVSSVDHSNPDAAYNMQAIGLLVFLPVLVYHVVLEITMNGQSVGKKIMGLKIVSENGAKASISQFFIRWLTRDIWFITLFFIGVQSTYGNRTEGTFIIILVLAYFVTEIVLVVSSKKGQRLGDILGKTILIKTNQKANINETVFQEVEDNYVPLFPQIMQLSDRDINAIKSIVETARRKGDFYMASNAAEKIKAHLVIQTDLSPFDLLDTLLKDYNYLSVK